MKKLLIKIKKLKHAEDIELPAYKTSGSAGLDLCAAIQNNLELKPLERVLIPTGLKIALLPGFEAQIRPRSGLAINHGITILNSPGTIDSDYRGEIKIILINLGNKSFTIKRGMRIAQLVVVKYEKVDIMLVDNLPDTQRADGGFGHTGI